MAGTPSFIATVALDGTNVRSIEHRQLTMAEIPYNGEMAAFALYNRVSSPYVVRINRWDVNAWAPVHRAAAVGLLQCVASMGIATGTAVDPVSPVQIAAHDTSVPLPAGITVVRASAITVPSPAARCAVGSLWNAANGNPGVMLTQMRGVSGALDMGILRTFTGGFEVAVGSSFSIAFAGSPAGQHEAVHVPFGIRIVFSVEGLQNTFGARTLLIASDTLNACGLLLRNQSASRVFVRQIQITEVTPNDSQAFVYTTNLIDAIEADGEPLPAIQCGDTPLPDAIRVQRNAQVSAVGEKRGAVLFNHMRRRMLVGYGNFDNFFGRNEVWQNLPGGLDQVMWRIRPGQGIALVLRATSLVGGPWVMGEFRAHFSLESVVAPAHGGVYVS